MKNRPKILIVEDNEDLQVIYRENFEAAGFEVVSVINGLEGVVSVVENTPDVVLLDIMMPQMNGYEFLEALKNNSSIEVAVVVCSNLSQQSDIDKAYDSGADLYLQKSDFQGPDLVERIQEFLKEQA